MQNYSFIYTIKYSKSVYYKIIYLVFQRFEKLNEFVQGTGLGLAICKLTIQYMGGDIWIDKNYKNGARFIFSHPIKKQESTEK
ncbi:sensor histidine kinase [Bacteroides ovatus]|uniref:histidine kinase n=1 Tax=Bacteroides ovatus TaxID=28116 RepID=A0A413EFJ0_BACOV|nr:ATP-binding protein [Bacteroides ovatus]RGX05614.1 sensor histidine kinase [Bacteroides ovatus]RGX16667.1 sensor histidine kinase [Bacteroides ovatus]